jgi:adenylate cyclase
MSTTSEAESPAELVGRTDRQLALVGILANGLGAATVFLFVVFIAPTTIDPGSLEGLVRVGAIVFVAYMALSLTAGRIRAARDYRRVVGWLADGRPATDGERQAVLAYPSRFAHIAAFFWTIGSALFALVGATVSAATAASLFAISVLGGATACALQYLLVERTLRPIIARALAGGAPPQSKMPGVAARMTMAWTLATGVPLLGIVAFSVAKAMGARLDGQELLFATIFLAAFAIGIGLSGMVIAARSVADPLDAVQRGLERVETGDLDARVAVDDGSEVGRLQAGFNRMATGLAERERMRDLFGRQVGRDVAEAALDGRTELGGEVRSVAVLFVDLVGSTGMAAERPPEEVVALLNSFFAIVVEVAEANSGWVNKFEGDAALCVFGAPIDVPDAPGKALCAARVLRERLGKSLPEVDVGIGISAGPAVAGNIGAEQRFEYTVIGDPVNEAARLCELAKKEPGRLLASEAALEGADPDERGHWSVGDAVRLRGRPEATRLASAAR